mmetsp:Transcript_41789/g.130889  ORF Transcript_41789/g.130889 Transcript_41789/m.130889 type:complete len:208 (-) Transcript_41789:938-1561(-)
MATTRPRPQARTVWRRWNPGPPTRVSRSSAGGPLACPWRCSWIAPGLKGTACLTLGRLASLGRIATTGYTCTPLTASRACRACPSLRTGRSTCTRTSSRATTAPQPSCSRPAPTSRTTAWRPPRSRPGPGPPHRRRRRRRRRPRLRGGRPRPHGRPRRPRGRLRAPLLWLLGRGRPRRRLGQQRRSLRARRPRRRRRPVDLLAATVQ